MTAGGATGGVVVRPAEAGDRAVWLRLWRAFLGFYDHPLPDEVTALTWARCLDPAHPMALRLAEVDGACQGFSLYQVHNSSWVAAPDCYLEDLFVAPEARGRGLGRALIDDLAALGRARGWARLYWMTDAGNQAARTLYDSYTATDGHVRYRFDL